MGNFTDLDVPFLTPLTAIPGLPVAYSDHHARVAVSSDSRHKSIIFKAVVESEPIRRSCEVQAVDTYECVGIA